MEKKSDQLAYSVVEVARMLGIPRNLAYEMVRARQLPAIRLGKRLLVPKRALERMLEDASTACNGRTGAGRR